MKKTVVTKMFDPEKHSMVFCPECRGCGKYFDEAKGVNVCKICGGFGLIKKEKENHSHDHSGMA